MLQADSRVTAFPQAITTGVRWSFPKRAGSPRSVSSPLTKIITVKVPKSRILSSEIDENSFQIYDEEQSIFNQLSSSNFNDTTAQMKANAEEKAIKKGLLDNADANAKLIINNFIASFDISDYTVTVVTAE